MPHPLLAAGRWFALRSLRTQILSLVMAAALLSTSLIGYLSYAERMRQTESEALHLAMALAGMTSRAVSAPLQERDDGALELFLSELIALPDVRSVELVHPGGRLAMQARRTPSGPVIARPSGEQADIPGSWQQVEGVSVRAVEPLMFSSVSKRLSVSTETLQRDGWVVVELSLVERRARALQQWLFGSFVALLLIMLLLWLFALFLRRVFGPIGALSRFTPTVATQPGVTVRMRWGSREVRELGRSINAVSERLAEQMETQRQRFERLRAILETAADAIIGVTADGRIHSINPAAERMLGLDASTLSGQPLVQWLPGMDAERLHQTMVEGMLIHSTQSRIGRVEMDAYRNGGIAFPVEVLLGEVTADPEIRYTCIVRDLTDIKLAEEYLTLYGRVLDCSPSGVSVSDARRYPQPIVHINPAFTRITGYAPHEILGRDAGLLEGPLTDRENLDLLARTVQNGGELKVTLHNYRKDGSLFHNKLSVSPVRDASGEITHYINVIEDVSGQVEVKQRLIERTARLNATFDLSPDGFAVFDKNGELISSNPSFSGMVGDIPLWCSLQRFDSWFRTLCDKSEDYRPIEQSLKEQSKDVISIVRPSPKVLEREIRKNLGGSGETILYFRDVTHQVEVDRIKSEFLATAAHELRTPLASILGFTELMLHRNYSEEKRKDLLQTVHRQGSLLQNLIQELLDLSRIEARQGKDFHIVPTELTRIVEAALTGISHSELGRQVQVGALPALTVMADASKIEQALVNLLSNAFKYSPAGGEVSLSVRESDRDGQPHAVVSVQDQGMGMTPEQLSRAFERFYRADTSGNIPGTGLGLNLVKEIAEIHGGTVELSSEPGVGTVASLWLRLTGEAAAVTTA